MAERERPLTTIGVVGLGLIGGSLAAAFKEKGHVVLGADKNKVTEDFARLAGSIDGHLDSESIGNCQTLIIAVTPDNGVEWLREMSDLIPKDAKVIDCCGTKRKICEEGFALAQEKGFTFIGGHPMAGKQVGGYKNSRADLFAGALFAIVPEDMSDINEINYVRTLMKEVGFTRFAVMTPEDHDKVIAFTSQMAHLISNAYIKSDMNDVGQGPAISAGAFRDMTRVAYLDEEMWTELFIENKDNLLSELDGFIGELDRYRKAIASEDRHILKALLREGKERKQEVENGGNE